MSFVPHVLSLLVHHVASWVWLVVMVGVLALIFSVTIRHIRITQRRVWLTQDIHSEGAMTLDVQSVRCVCCHRPVVQHHLSYGLSSRRLTEPVCGRCQCWIVTQLRRMYDEQAHAAAHREAMQVVGSPQPTPYGDRLRDVR